MSKVQGFVGIGEEYSTITFFLMQVFFHTRHSKNEEIRTAASNHRKWINLKTL